MSGVLGKDGVVGSIPIGSTTFPPFFTSNLTNVHATRRERTAMSGEKSVESRLALVGFVRTKLDRAGTQAIRRMFWTDVRFSTRGDGFFYDLLAGAIERQLVVVSEWTYAPLIVDPHEPPRFENADRELWRDAYGGGGDCHRALKFEAAKIMQARGLVSQFEQRCCVGVVDVACGPAAIECGNTEPKRVFDALGDGDFREFWLFPFPGVRFAGEEPTGHRCWRFKMPTAGRVWWRAFWERATDGAANALEGPGGRGRT